MIAKRFGLVILFLLALLSGCALQPAGLKKERRAAEAAGKAWEEPIPLPALPEKPSLDDYLHYAFLANADLQTQYWQWRAAIEQVPQDVALPRIAIPFSFMFSKENMKAWDRTTLGIGNDPMTNIPFPAKLSTAGRRALEEARAAGARFEKAKFLLQGRVLAGWYDLALLAETIRIQEENVTLLEMIAEQAAVRVKAGTAPQLDLLSAHTELDLGRNELQTLRSQVPAAVARLNALLGRPAEAPVPLPDALPQPRPLPVADDELIRIGSERSSDLSALARDVAGREEALTLAKQARLPDFGLMASITGSVEQMVGGMLVLPSQFQAIKAGVAQARANLKAAEAARVQYARDLAASFVLNLYVLRNDERQTQLFESSILPRTKQAIAVAQTAYANNRLTFPEMLEAQRTLLDVRLVIAQLRTEREKALAAVETWSAVDVEVMQPARVNLRPSGDVGDGTQTEGMGGEKPSAAPSGRRGGGGMGGM